MLEPPDLPSHDIVACLDQHYGLGIAQIEFLSLGADPHTAVYRAVAADANAYFVKLRSGGFDQASVLVPNFLSQGGIAPIIPPVITRTRQLWASLDRFIVILYPFVEGRNGYAAALSDQHWRTFGAAVKRMHTAAFPAALLERIPRETYSAQARAQVTAIMAQLGLTATPDRVAQEAAGFMQAKRDATRQLVARAEQLAQALLARTPPGVVCHADLHAGNLYIDNDDTLYIVDWDTLLVAPKERDLMFAGGAQGFTGHTPQAEEALFYQGYGQTSIDRAALAYYRYERIIQDIAIYCEQLLLTDEGGADRAQSLHYLMGNFLPGGTIERAYAADQLPPP